MQAKHIYKIFEIAVILIACSLCLTLAWFNRRANDNHVEVSKLIIDSLRQGQFQSKLDTCWECYHPKLFHYSAALIRGFDNSKSLIFSANLLNYSCWLVTCLILTSLIFENFRAGRLRIALLSFCWLNPSLITVGSQATNDAFVTLFGTIALRLISWCLELFSPAVVTAVLLAVFTKGSGLVLLIAANIRLIASFIIQKAFSNYRIILPFAVSLLIYATPFILPEKLSPHGRFVDNSIKQGELSGLRFKPKEIPAFYQAKEECLKNPKSMCSILDGFFSFKLTSLILYPYIPRSEAIYPDHMRSLWTTIYARYYLHVFPQHFWRDESPFMHNVSRILVILGLFPLSALLIGFLKALRFDFIKSAFWKDFIDGKAIFHVTVCLGLLLMLAIFNLFYQRHPGYKEIYLFCGLFSFWYLFINGIKDINKRGKFYKNITVNILALISFLWLLGLIKIIHSCV